MTNYQKRLQGELETEAKRLDWLYARMNALLPTTDRSGTAKDRTDGDLSGRRQTGLAAMKGRQRQVINRS